MSIDSLSSIDLELLAAFNAAAAESTYMWQCEMAAEEFGRELDRLAKKD
jgi:hypothetical protein